MKNLQTYENWLKKVWNKLMEPKDYKEYPADFNDKEIKELEDLSFELDTELHHAIGSIEFFTFKSIMNDIEIVITKDFVEDVPGAANSVFSVTLKGGEYDGEVKVFEDFDKLIDFVKPLVPEEEIESEKYNL